MLVMCIVYFIVNSKSRISKYSFLKEKKSKLKKKIIINKAAVFLKSGKFIHSKINKCKIGLFK